MRVVLEHSFTNSDFKVIRQIEANDTLFKKKVVCTRLVTRGQRGLILNNPCPNVHEYIDIVAVAT